MADTKISALTDGVAVAATDRIPIARSPFASGDNRYLTGAEFRAYIDDDLTASRAYYVRTDGSDSNDGLANTAGGAFLTIQKAFDVAASLGSDAIGGGYWPITINVGAGTFNLGGFPNILGGPFGHLIKLIGAGVASTFFTNGSIWATQAQLEVADFTITPNTGGHGIKADHYGYIFITGVVKVIGTSIETGISGNADSHVLLYGELQLQGAFRRGLWTEQHGQIYVFGGNITLLSSPTFSIGFVKAGQFAPIYYGPTTVTGTAVGPKFDIRDGSVIMTNTTVAGTTAGVGSGFSTVTSPTGVNEVMYVGTAAAIADTNGNELIKFPATISNAVNEFTVRNSATGVSPRITATGDDSSIGMVLEAKGTDTFVQMLSSSLGAEYFNVRLQSDKITVTMNTDNFLAQIILDSWLSIFAFGTLGLLTVGTNPISMFTNEIERLTIDGTTGAATFSASITAATFVKTTATTFGGLPAAATAGAGARAFITDCNTSTFNATAATGGANAVPVFSDGSIWKVG